MSAEKKLEMSTSTERSEKLASMQSLLEKELDLEESLLNEELSTIDMKSNDIEPDKLIDTTDKSVDTIRDQSGDSDIQDDDFKLTYEDDDEDPKSPLPLLEETVSDTGDKPCKIDLSFPEDVIKTIEEEEKLLDTLECKKSSSVLNSKSGHGLNKPDMMLEIPTQELIEFSDDEGDGNQKFETSDSDTINEDFKSITKEKLFLEEKKSKDNLDREESSETSDDLNKLTEKLTAEDEKIIEENSSKEEMTPIDEAKLAADILTKELNAMDEGTEMEENFVQQIEGGDETYETNELLKEENQINKSEDEDIDAIDIDIQQEVENITGSINIETIDNNENSLLSLPGNENYITNSDAMIGSTLVAEHEISVHRMEIDGMGLTESQKNIPLVISKSVSFHEDEKIRSENEMENDETEVSELNISQIESVVTEFPVGEINVGNMKVKTTKVSKQSIDMDIAKEKDNSREVTLQIESEVMESGKDALDYITEINDNKNSKVDSLSQSDTNTEVSPSIEPLPSTSQGGDDTKSEPSTSVGKKNENEFGSSAQNMDMLEMEDSLGLLAESIRVMEEEEELDDDDEGDEDDEYDHYQDDESSNQVTAEHSEDSNAQHSETDAPKSDDQFLHDEITNDNDQKSEVECNDEPEDKPTEICENDTKEDSDQNEPQNEESTEMESEKLPDTDNENDSVLRNLLLENDSEDKPVENEKQSPTKRKLEVAKIDNIPNIVVLEESSSEDEKANNLKATSSQEDQTIKTEEVTKDKTTELKSSTATPATEAVTKDEAKIDETESVNKSPKKAKSPVGLEVFSLDSDEEEPVEKIKENVENIKKSVTPEKQKLNSKLDTPKCINRLCTKTNAEFYIANKQTVKFYDVDRKKRCYVCQECNDAVEERNMELILGIKNFTPLLEMNLQKKKEELVEISDSESEEEEEPESQDDQTIGEDGAKLLEEKLADMINETWKKFNMDERLVETQNVFEKELQRLQNESNDLNDILDECQVATDKLRNDLYSTFEPRIVELPSLVMYDTPTCSYTCLNPTTAKRLENKLKEPKIRQKRTLSPSAEVPSKRAAIPLGYTPLDNKTNQESIDKMDDDNQEVSVVKLSAESAPSDLPPPGDLDLTLAPLKLGMTVYAMKNAFRSWLRAKIVELTPKSAGNPFTLCRVKFENTISKQPFKMLQARALAYPEPPEVRMTIGRRVIALFKDTDKKELYYSGVVAEMPNPVNNYRYLIFFDDGYAQYAPHSETRVVCESSPLVWEEVHSYSREFVRQYLQSYPERPMVRLHAGQHLKTEWRGKWWSSQVLRVDASLVEVQFLKISRREWIYRGSTRLAPLFLELKAAERHRPRAMPRSQIHSNTKTNMPYVEYTRSDEQKSVEAQRQLVLIQQEEEIKRQRAVAKKSTSSLVPPPNKAQTTNLDSVCSRVVYYTPKNAVKPYKMVPHVCTPQCKRSDVLALKDLRTYNPLAKPLLSGWERQIVRWRGHKEVMYKAPCGRRVRNMSELHKYLRDIESDMAVDLFDFSPLTHCLAEFVLNNCYVGKKDLSHGRENVPVPCVNYYDESLPEFCSYNTERTPTAGVPLNLDSDFLCGCDCEDDCEDKTKCACWKMTLEGARTIGLVGENVGYEYKRLPDPLPSGIYECNSRCKCKHTCLNRVAQHPLQLKLQVFKTSNRGWGIRALNDIPKGAFICVYAGNLLTDATANLDGLNEGDEYLAELDYIEVVEQMKEGFEEDIPDKIKNLDKNGGSQQPSEESEEESSGEDSNSKNEHEDDDDFQPGYIPGQAEETTVFSKRLRKRNLRKDKEEEESQKEKENEKKAKDDKDPDEECITISDDEEAREPSCFTAAANMGAKQFKSKYSSVRTLFGEDEACYIMDAKVQGNIGRYLNHSCLPNVFVQNVFVDTHDPRFPWVAFFALSYIKAGTELTWNYNYDVGSVPGKVLYCYCGAANCRGRLL